MDSTSTSNTPLTAVTPIPANGGNGVNILPGAAATFPAISAQTTATGASLTAPTIDTAGTVVQVTYYPNGGFAIAATVGGTTYNDAFAANTEARVDPLSTSYNQYLANSTTLTSTVAIYAPTDTTQALSYTNFGVWTRDKADGSATIGLPFAVGYETPANAVPVAGTATYNGATLGVAAAGGNTYTLEGNVTVTANFASANVAASFTNMQAINDSTRTASAWNSFTGNANYAAGSNTFSGSTSAPAGGSVISPSAMTGLIAGKFFGPAAQEVGGTWTLTGGGTTALGAFGAKK